MAQIVSFGFDEIQAGGLRAPFRKTRSVPCNRTPPPVIHIMEAGSFTCELLRLRLYMKVFLRRYMEERNEWSLI